jgi:hypothetical protein
MSYEHVVSPSYIIFKEDSKYLARNGKTGVIDYSGTNAATVIQAVIDGHNNTIGGTYILKGKIDLDTTITISQKDDFKLVFDALYITADVDGIIINDNQDVRNVELIGKEIQVNIAGNYTHTALTLKNTHYTHVDVKYITKTGNVNGTAIEISSDNVSGSHANHVKIGQILGYATGILLKTSGDGFVSRNFIDKAYIKICNYCIKLETTTTTYSIFDNVFRDCAADKPGYGAGVIGYGIHITGKCCNNIFDNYAAWQMSSTVAGSRSYYADSNVRGTLFIGGIPQHYVQGDASPNKFWNDSGVDTEIYSEWTTTEAGLRRSMTDKTIFFPVTQGTNGITDYGRYPVAVISLATDAARTIFHIPDDFNKLIEAKLVVIPCVTLTAAQWNIGTTYASAGETYNYHNKLNNTSTYNVTIDVMTEIDFTSLLQTPDVSAGDYVGVVAGMRDDTHDYRVLGVRLKYR